MTIITLKHKGSNYRAQITSIGLMDNGNCRVWGHLFNGQTPLKKFEANVKQTTGAFRVSFNNRTTLTFHLPQSMIMRDEK